MALVTVYGRETTFKVSLAPGAFTLSNPIYSFDPIPDAPMGDTVPVGDGSFVELGRRFTLDIEVPGDDGLLDVGGSGFKCVASPEGQHLGVLDVTTRAYQAVEGYRIADAKWQD